jgi:hypothetical protein
MKTRKFMRTSLKTLATAFGALAVALLLAPSSFAQCNGLRQLLPTHTSWQPQLGQGRLLRTAHAATNGGIDLFDSVEPIVGLWHVKFMAGSNAVDAGYAEWHSDGTEIMNSGGRPAASSNFCLGMWQKVGERTYKLNHFATSWTPDGTTLVGPASIREEVTVRPDGQSFSGTFSIVQYTENDQSEPHTIAFLQSVSGTITGTRISINTAPSPIF